MNIQDQYVEFQLDNGSTANILPTHVYVRLTGDKEFQDLKKTDVTLQMYNKSETKAVVTIRLSVRNPCNRKKYNLLLCDCAWQRATLYSRKTSY